MLVHALLERLDFRRPVRPAAERGRRGRGRWSASRRARRRSAELRELVERFGASELCERLAAAGDVRREERFAFLLEPPG